MLRSSLKRVNRWWYWIWRSSINDIWPVHLGSGENKYDKYDDDYDNVNNSNKITGYSINNSGKYDNNSEEGNAGDDDHNFNGDKNNDITIINNDYKYNYITNNKQL